MVHLSRCPDALVVGLGVVLIVQSIGTAQAPSSSAAPAAPRPLSAAAQALELGIDQAHAYHQMLRTGEFLHITIDQQGVDVVAVLLRPDGSEAVSVSGMDDELRPETLVAIADVDGRHLIQVRPAPEARTGGRYAIRVEASRPSTPEDHRRIETERTFTRGRQVRDPGRAATWPEALTLLTTALGGFRELADRRGEMKTLIEMAITQYYLSMPEALDTARQAERLARELGDRPAAARALKSAGNTLVFQGDLPAAILAFEESTRLSREVGHRNAEGRSLNDTAIAYRRMGEVERAVAAYEQALPLLRATNDRPMEANILSNLGVAYRNLGEYTRALGFYEQALANRREVKDTRGAYNLLLNSGNLHRQLRNYDKARELHAEALRMTRESGDRGREGSVLHAMGLTAFEQSEYETALTHHRDALAMQREVGDLSAQAGALEGLGRTLNRLGRREEALIALQDALVLDRTLRERYAERDVLSRIAEVEHDSGNLAEASTYLAASLDLDEQLRAEITSPELRASFVAAEQNRYEQFIDVLHRRHAADPTGGYQARALEVSERARARVLLDSLLDARVDLREGVEPALLERERRLQRQLNDASAQLSRTLATGARTDAAKAAAARVDQLSAQYQDLQAQIRRQSPRYAAATLPEPLSARQIQERVLDAETVLLEYMLGEARSWLWAVTQNGVTSVELPPRAEIEKAVRSLYAALSARRREPGEAAGDYERRVRQADARLDRERASVAALLLGPIGRELNQEWQGRRLAIVAGGVLEYLPFSVLAIPVPTSSGPVAASGTPVRAAARVPLVARHEIVYVPSASVLDAIRRDTAGRPPARRGVAVLADPVFEISDPRLSAQARLRPSAGSPTGQDGPAPSPAARTIDRGSLVRLPFSREEASAIASLVPAADALVATDFSASRAIVLGGALSGYGVVHFATHGVFDARSPALSGLVLSLVSQSGQPQDGFVRLNDIYNMRLDADLVVLSACQTALGTEIRGEGLVGLARAFMYAGAPRVVASLWQVNDLATAELMKRFYRGLLVERLRPAAALRAAQLALSRDPRWASPYYWAGFVLQGDWRGGSSG
jgi:CHAT domain-containing protein/Flp pilus assembly protein TadD